MLLSLRMIALLHPGAHVAAVSHAAMVRLAITEVSGVPRRDWRVSLPNGSVTVFEVDADLAFRVVRQPAAAPA
jgi:broad specificity phosphatase PhoE